MRYRPDLDGMRAVAVLAVMASHTGFAFCEGGWMGVCVFFVLSGYLITTLLLSEQARTGRISLRAFYKRRILRLYPALITVIVVLGVLFSIGLGYGPMLTYVLSAARSALYLEDFGASAGVPGLLPHTWSLSIEEQFYLVWPPILVWFLGRRRDPLRWALLGIAASWAALAYEVTHGGPYVEYPGYYSPWNRFGELLVGCALALLLAKAGSAPGAIRGRLSGYVLVATGIGLVYAAQYEPRRPNLGWEAPAIALVTAATIWHLSVSDAHGLRSLLGSRILRWIGQRSYGIYLIHVPVILVLRDRLQGAHRGELCALMVVMTGVLAALSYRYVETPFLRRKNQLEGASDLTAVLPATTGIPVAAARIV